MLKVEECIGYRERCYTFKKAFANFLGTQIYSNSGSKSSKAIVTVCAAPNQLATISKDICTLRTKIQLK